MVIKNNLKVVLVEPAGPINVGSVARLCENFNIQELRLVSPRCNPTAPEALKMAVKGSSFLKNAQIFNCLIDAIQDCQKIIKSQTQTAPQKETPQQKYKTPTSLWRELV